MSQDGARGVKPAGPSLRPLRPEAMIPFHGSAIENLGHCVEGCPKGLPMVTRGFVHPQGYFLVSGKRVQGG